MAILRVKNSLTGEWQEIEAIKGTDGYTPQKGVDYFTEEDIASLNIPDELKDLSDDSTHRLVTDTEKATWNAKSDFSGSYNDLTNKPDLSGYITKDVNDLTYYTTTSGMTTAIGVETTNRQNADTALQGQIDAITSASDVVDVVSTYADLQSYDTSKLTEKDVIKVMQDSTHSNAISYYRWVSSAWSYVGSEGPFYTKGETDTLLNAKQPTIDNNNKLPYSLISGTPTIPSKTSDLTNDSDYTTKTYVDGLVGNVESILEELDIGGGI